MEGLGFTMICKMAYEMLGDLFLGLDLIAFGFGHVKKHIGSKQGTSFYFSILNDLIK